MSHFIEQYVSHSRLVERLPQAANVLLILLIAYTSAGIFWKVVVATDRFRLDAAATHSQHAVTPVRTLQKRQGPEQAIIDAHLFGTAEAGRLVQTQPAPEAPETRLNLTLKGVYATGDARALAIIASGGRNEEFYKVGDSIPGGARLKAVYPDRVILERNGRLETLRLPKAKGKGIDITRTAIHSGAQTRSGTASGETGLQGLREQIVDDPEILGEMLEAKPARQGGRFVGYELFPGDDDRLFRELGLEEGDIVVSVNGLRIDEPQKGFRALRSLADAKDIKLVLLRDGDRLTVQRGLTP